PGVNDGPRGGNSDGPGGGIRSVVQKKRTTTVPLPTAIPRASPAHGDPREPTRLAGPGEHKDRGDEGPRGPPAGLAHRLQEPLFHQEPDLGRGAVPEDDRVLAQELRDGVQDA